VKNISRITRHGSRFTSHLSRILQNTVDRRIIVDPRGVAALKAGIDHFVRAAGDAQEGIIQIDRARRVCSNEDGGQRTEESRPAIESLKPLSRMMALTQRLQWFSVIQSFAGYRITLIITTLSTDLRHLLGGAAQPH
jgi:hypothetical protein